MLILKPEVLTERDGVSLTHEMWFAIGSANALFELHAQAPCVVTSLLDGTHNPNSLHPKGRAVDLRTKHITVKQAELIFSFLQHVLEPCGFDVVWEGGVGATPATTGAHIHVEFDPKGRQFSKTEGSAIAHAVPAAAETP
jgi:hypothetical protein